MSWEEGDGRAVTLQGKRLLKVKVGRQEGDALLGEDNRVRADPMCKGSVSGLASRELLYSVRPHRSRVDLAGMYARGARNTRDPAWETSAQGSTVTEFYAS